MSYPTIGDSYLSTLRLPSLLDGPSLPILKIDEFCWARRWLCKTSGSLRTFSRSFIHHVWACGNRHRVVGRCAFAGPIILPGFQKTRLWRVRRATRVSGDVQRPLIWHEIADIEGRRNSPVRWNGDVVGVGIDLPTDLEGACSARV